VKGIMWDHLDDVLAVVLVVGCFVLLGLGIDSDVKAILAGGAAWVFRGAYTRARDRRRRKK